MRTIHTDAIVVAVRDLFLEANYFIGEDIEKAVRRGRDAEPSPVGRETLAQILDNYAIAREERVAICQDTGMAVVFADIGQDVRIEGTAFEDAINAGVRAAYEEGYLRKSVVSDPLFDRINTKDNTPAILHVRIIPGDEIHLLVTPKGFGSENMSKTKMLVPSDGVEGVKRFVAETAIEAGPNPCPPVIVGVGIGGTMEMAALMAKRMTARPIDRRNADPRYAALEEEILAAINASGVGPGGTGGYVTALAVNIDWYPTHIAGMPVAVNICCHCARHAERTI